MPRRPWFIEVLSTHEPPQNSKARQLTGTVSSAATGALQHSGLVRRVGYSPPST